ncbi:MAG: glycosyltransferase [bacterium]|nr:glycosyltransferase [bacterium]
MINEILPSNSNQRSYFESHLHFGQAAVAKQMDLKADPVLPTKANHTEILIITSYPPSECGIATYTQDLKDAIFNKFSDSMRIKICALENNNIHYNYPSEVKYKLQSNELNDYEKLAHKINADPNIQLVFIQHEFGLYGGKYGSYILQLFSFLEKPIITTLHTVLPNPEIERKETICKIADFSKSLIVMTQNAARILEKEYGIAKEKIVVIPHGTHLVSAPSSRKIKLKAYLENRIILSTFGLLSPGKSIETALMAMPAIVKEFPNALYLILGKTHPGIIKNEGEKYRDFLYEKVNELELTNNVKFINHYLELNEILDYLQRSDIYLFTSKDPNQAVSGTLAYAVACGCPVVATPIPHANELLGNNPEVIFEFGNSNQLSEVVNNLLKNQTLRKDIKNNGLHLTAATAWQNAAIAHARLFEQFVSSKITLDYAIPPINLNHIKHMTTDVGMIQFSKINEPDIHSGYTLDDNARALIAMCANFEQSKSSTDLSIINTYLNFIEYCQQSDGSFLNYVDVDKKFTLQNEGENLEDANGRAVWAMGYIISKAPIFPSSMVDKASKCLLLAIPNLNNTHSARAMAFAIKGLYYFNTNEASNNTIFLIKVLANRLVQMYRHEKNTDWHWFESYLTYGNSILPEALLCAHLATGELIYKDIAFTTFDFLLSIIYNQNGIQVVSNRGWHLKGESVNQYGEQPIDVAYTILALDRFYAITKNPEYLTKLRIGFNWFLGNNHLNQIIYNPCTGGCYDGLEETHVNINQGAESSVSYLMARLVMEKYIEPKSAFEQKQDNEPHQMLPKAIEAIIRRSEINEALHV